MINNFLEKKECQICSEKSNFDIIYKWPKNYYNHKKYETYSWDGKQKIDLSIVKCNKCNFVFTYPSFKEESLNLVYPNQLIKYPKNINTLLNINIKKYNELLMIIKKYINKIEFLHI